MTPSRKNEGFTIIEILVVLVIIGLMAGLVVPNLLGKTDDARITLAKQDLQTIANALEMYRLDNFQYPSTQQGLKALVEKPTGRPEAKNWAENGYIRNIPEDPWGNPYQYASPARYTTAQQKKPFDLYSFGADGQRDGEGMNQDIHVWEQ